MKIAGAILAGGAGRRLGGVDKARLDLGGEWMAARVAARLAPQVDQLALVARGDPARFAPLVLPVLADGIPGGAGPLAGLLGALDWAAEIGAEAVLSVPVDTPFLPPDLGARLASALGAGPAAIAVAGGRRHPVCGLWRVALRGPLRAALEGGMRRVDAFATGIVAAEATFDAAEAFLNINTPEDLRAARARAAAARPVAGGFDRIVMVDWSASGAPSPRKPSADAIWIGTADENGAQATYHRTRAEAEAALGNAFAKVRAQGARVLAGFDFPLGYPTGFVRCLTGAQSAFALWDWLEAHVEDAPDNANNRFQLAARINALLHGRGPFWGRPEGLNLPDLPARKLVDYGPAMPERRRVEEAARRAQPVWKLYTTGSVGSQALLGLPMLARLRKRFGAAVWPFDAPDGPLVLAEIYPAVIEPEVKAAMTEGTIKDALQVRLLAQAFWRLQAGGGLADAFAAAPDWPGRQEEGWILGVGVEAALRAAARQADSPPGRSGRSSAPKP